MGLTKYIAICSACYTCYLLYPPPNPYPHPPLPPTNYCILYLSGTGSGYLSLGTGILGEVSQSPVPMVQFEDTASSALSVLEALHLAVLSVEIQIKAQIEFLQAKVAAMRERQERRLAVAAKRKAKVRLNVGGRLFAVHMDELLRRPDSLLF